MSESRPLPVQILVEADEDPFAADFDAAMDEIAAHPRLTREVRVAAVGRQRCPRLPQRDHRFAAHHKTAATVHPQEGRLMGVVYRFAEVINIAETTATKAEGKRSPLYKRKQGQRTNSTGFLVETHSTRRTHTRTGKWRRYPKNPKKFPRIRGDETNGISRGPM